MRVSSRTRTVLGIVILGKGVNNSSERGIGSEERKQKRARAITDTPEAKPSFYTNGLQSSVLLSLVHMLQESSRMLYEFMYLSDQYR